MYMYIYIYIYIYIYVHQTLQLAPVGSARPRLSARAAAETHLCSRLLCQSYIFKGMTTGHRLFCKEFQNSYVSTLCPVVICPYLCTSDYVMLCYVLLGCTATRSILTSTIMSSCATQGGTSLKRFAQRL